MYLGSTEVKAIYLGDNLIIGQTTTTTYEDIRYTLSLSIASSATLEAKYSAYSYISANASVSGMNDPTEITIPAYMHNSYSYIRFLVDSDALNSSTNIQNVPPTISYTISEGGGVKLIPTLNHTQLGQYELLVFTGRYPQLNTPHITFSIFTAYQKINCNVWRSSWYNNDITEEPEIPDYGSSAQIKIQPTISNAAVDYKFIGVTMTVTPSNVTKTILLGVNANGTVISIGTETFVLQTGVKNYIQFKNLKFGNEVSQLLPNATGFLVATVNGKAYTVAAGNLGSSLMQGSLELDCTGTLYNSFVISLEVQLNQLLN